MANFPIGRAYAEDAVSHDVKRSNKPSSEHGRRSTDSFLCWLKDEVNVACLGEVARCAQHARCC
jgi:hypothetical protein